MLRETRKVSSDSESMTARSRGLRLQSSDGKSEGIVPATAPNRCRVAVPCNYFFFALIVDGFFSFLTGGTVFAQNHGLKVNSCKTWKIIYMKNIV